MNTGSGMKDDKLKSKDFFNVKEDLWLLKTPADFRPAAALFRPVNGQPSDRFAWCSCFLIPETLRRRDERPTITLASFRLF